MIDKKAEGFLKEIAFIFQTAKINIVCIEEIVESSDCDPAKNAFNNIKLQMKCLESNVEFLLENCKDWDEPFCGEGGL